MFDVTKSRWSATDTRHCHLIPGPGPGPGHMTHWYIWTLCQPTKEDVAVMEEWNLVWNLDGKETLNFQMEPYIRGQDSWKSLNVHDLINIFFSSPPEECWHDPSQYLFAEKYLSVSFIRVFLVGGQLFLAFSICTSMTFYACFYTICFSLLQNKCAFL